MFSFKKIENFILILTFLFSSSCIWVDLKHFPLCFGLANKPKIDYLHSSKNDQTDLHFFSSSRAHCNLMVAVLNHFTNWTLFNPIFKQLGPTKYMLRSLQLENLYVWTEGGWLCISTFSADAAIPW